MLISFFSAFAFLSGTEISNYETFKYKLMEAQAGFQFERDDSGEGSESVPESVSALAA